ncbi:MAG: sugar phosphate isomerase/epimerase [Ruminococcaceae bacterium]|nr:sugar phosphate isomerase/epimerase [Oscillospiraceae bacterium]
MIGIQLYTVRKLMTDLESSRKTVRALRELGYECAQLAGNIDTVEMTAEACHLEGMPVVGILVDIKICEDEKERLFAAARLCGAKDIGISSSVSNDEDTAELLKRANAFSKEAEREGFTFSYHNHSLEFIRCESGRTVMEKICDGLCGYLMPDTYWLQHGGADVRDFIEKNGKRVKILHLKDMKRAIDGPTFAEIGRGNLNMLGIVECAKSVGIDCFVVEQDKCDGDPLESARMSIEHLKKII